MFSTFESITKNFRLRIKELCIDNVAFKLHYRATTIILLVACVLVCSRQYIGDHINCITNDKAVPENVMNTFCFFTATFTLKSLYNDSLLQESYMPYPGIGPSQLRTVKSNGGSDVQRHNYYQWVPFVLFGQALAFYLPHYIWKLKEGGRMSALTEKLKYSSYALTELPGLKTPCGQFIPTPAAVRLELANLKRTFLERMHLHTFWSLWLIICEILNAINLFLQFYLTDLFLRGRFHTLGLDVLRTFDEPINALDEAFPKLAKCSFHKYGPSGSLQTHDALCVLALNIVNEKIYAFLWWWYIFLCVVTLAALLWRIIAFCFHARISCLNKLAFPGAWSRRLAVTYNFHFFDWLFLSYLYANVGNFIFKDLLRALAKDFSTNEDCDFNKCEEKKFCEPE